MVELAIALLGIYVGWWARERWGNYIVRRHFEQIRRRYEAERLRDTDPKSIPPRNSGGNGWSSDS